MAKQIGRYSFEVGIIEDSAARVAIPKTLKSFAGGDARSAGKRVGRMQSLGAKLQAFYGWLDKPFKIESNKDILRFADNYIAEVQKGKPNEKRLINLVQAIVRNPILREDYGHNRAARIKEKGFDRLLIDTGTFFNAIRARIVK